MYNNISEIKKANKERGHFWFNEDCRAETGIIEGRYWIESRPKDLRGEETGRTYGVVMAEDNGEVRWVDSEAILLPTFEEAKAVLDKHLGRA